ncbi:MAG: DUF3592 domain-containing protein [Moraxellaceae bacterium]
MKSGCDRYSVQGVEYESSRVAFAYGATKDRVMHQRIYEKLKSASTVPVYYDPQQASRSALTAEKDSTLWIFGIIWTAVVFLLFLGKLLGK